MNILDYVLKKTDGALFVRMEIYAACVGISKQTARNQISAKTFPLPLVRIGRSVFVKALDLANFLETGISPRAASEVQSAPRRPGRPRKYSEAARNQAAKRNAPRNEGGK
jgi:hypothetical protein